jgi:hypothetical protein
MTTSIYARAISRLTFAAAAGPGERQCDSSTIVSEILDTVKARRDVLMSFRSPMSNEFPVPSARFLPRIGGITAFHTESGIAWLHLRRDSVSGVIFS